MIVALLGSASEESITRRGVLALSEQVRSAGAAFVLLDLRTEFRRLHDLADYAAPAAGGQTAELRARIAQASGVVLATPVYHGSYSGLLKNALDHLTGEALVGLPVGTMAAGGGVRSASVACDHLRSVIRAMGGWSTPTHVGMSSADFTDEGPTADLRQRIADMVAELLSFPARDAFRNGAP